MFKLLLSNDSPQKRCDRSSLPSWRGFELYVRSSNQRQPNLLLRHSPENSCIFVASTADDNGQTQKKHNFITFTEHEGHFKITDPYNPRDRLALSIVSVSASRKSDRTAADGELYPITLGTLTSIIDADDAVIDFGLKQQSSGENNPIALVRMHIKQQAELSEYADAAIVIDIEKIKQIPNSNSSSSLCVERIWLRLPASASEHFYGAGEQFSHFDLRGTFPYTFIFGRALVHDAVVRDPGTVNGSERTEIFSDCRDLIKFSIHTGKKFPIWTREQGVGRDRQHPLWAVAEQFGTGYGGDYHTTYFPQASYASSKGYYFFVSDHGRDGLSSMQHGTFYSELDFQHTAASDSYDNGFVEIMLYGTFPFQFSVLTAASCTRAIQAFTKFTQNPVGGPLPVPSWVHEGAILGLQGGTELVKTITKNFLAAGGVVRGVWIQDWVGKFDTGFGQRLFWNWVWDSKRYTLLPEFVQRLLQQHQIRTLGYVSPHVRCDGSLFREAEAAGFLLRDSENNDSTLLQDFGEFTCGTIDLSSTAACEWYKRTLRTNMIDQLGFSGWMADFSEYLPTRARFAATDGKTSPPLNGLQLHNAFPVMWAKLNYEIATENGKNEIFYWMRAGGFGSQRYMQMLWAGDQCQSFEPKADGLASVITAFLSSGVSGVGVNHFDVGLFTGFTIPKEISMQQQDTNFDIEPVIRTRELLFRCAELAVFTPVFRTHEGNRPKLSHQFYSDASTMQIFALYTQAFAALAPYDQLVMRERHELGLPVFRPMFYFLEELDTSQRGKLDASVLNACWTVQDQYAYGSMLLVAPVVDKGAVARKVFLPPLCNRNGGDGKWIRISSSKEGFKSGQWVMVPADIGSPAVFYNFDDANLHKFSDIINELRRVFTNIQALIGSNSNEANILA